MGFQVGDTVVHWVYGLGEITGHEERALMGESQLYFVVKVQDMNVWVPADRQVASRLRRPTPAKEFSKLFAILRGPTGALSQDRRERKAQLRAQLAGGGAESICHVIRDLTTLQQQKSLNDDDQTMLKKARGLLTREWGYSLEIGPAQAEADLYQLLTKP